MLGIRDANAGLELAYVSGFSRVLVVAETARIRVTAPGQRRCSDAVFRARTALLAAE